MACTHTLLSNGRFVSICLTLVCACVYLHVYEVLYSGVVTLVSLCMFTVCKTSDMWLKYTRATMPQSNHVCVYGLGVLSISPLAVNSYRSSVVMPLILSDCCSLDSNSWNWDNCW